MREDRIKFTHTPQWFCVYLLYALYCIRFCGEEITLANRAPVLKEIISWENSIYIVNIIGEKNVIKC